jgi:hypothetical protein
MPVSPLVLDTVRAGGDDPGAPPGAGERGVEDRLGRRSAVELRREADLQRGHALGSHVLAHLRRRAGDGILRVEQGTIAPYERRLYDTLRGG